MRTIHTGRRPRRSLIRTAAAAVAILGMTATPALACPSSGPVLAFSPSSHGGFSYPDTTSGQTSTQTFTLKNDGRRASSALRLTLTGDSTFSVTDDRCTGTSIGRHHACTVTVAFAPTTAGDTSQAVLTAIGAAKHRSYRASVTLSGTATGTADLTLSPGTYALTEGNGAKLYGYDNGFAVGDWTTTFTVTNSGDGPSAQLAPVATHGEPSFSVGHDTCDARTLAPGETCTFDVTFAEPAGCTSNDTRSALVQVWSTDPALAFIIDLNVDGFCDTPPAA